MSVVCPNCGSDKVSFRREKKSSRSRSGGHSVRIAPGVRVGSGSRKTIYEYKSIGFCKACGNTWNSGENISGGGFGCIGIFFALCFWPFVVTYFVIKSQLQTKWKAVILGVMWVFIVLTIIFAQASSSNLDSSTGPIIIIEESGK